MAGMNKGNRPTGISALAILEILGGIVAIIGGLILAVATSSILGGLGSLLGIVAIISGLFAFAIGYGFWTANISLELETLYLNITHGLLF